MKQRTGTSLRLGLLVFLAAIIGACAVPLAWGKDAIVLTTVGTSLTADRLWQDRLARKVAACSGRQVVVKTVAQGGVSSRWGLQRLDDIAATAPDVVLVEFAVNDANPVNSLSLKQSLDNTAAIVADIKRQAAGASVFLVTTNPIYRAAVATRPELDAYYRQYAVVARRHGVGLIDLYPVWKKGLVDRRDLIPDGVHPIAEAYEIVLPKMASAICSSL